MCVNVLVKLLLTYVIVCHGDIICLLFYPIAMGSTEDKTGTSQSVSQSVSQSNFNIPCWSKLTTSNYKCTEIIEGLL